MKCRELWRGTEVRTNLSIQFCGDESCSEAFNGSLGVSPLNNCGRAYAALTGEVIWSMPVLANSLACILGFLLGESPRLFPSKTSMACLSVPSASVLQIPLDSGVEDLTQNPKLCAIPQRS